METWRPDGLEIVCVLAREDPRDALLAAKATSLAGLPMGAKVGTASLRRQAQLLRRRPDLSIKPIRGNVNTRIDKLASGEFDAIVVAVCGLERLGKADLATEILMPNIMLPAVGQGALAIECRVGDDALRQLLEPLHDPTTAACVGAERAMLAALDGSCRTPIAGLAECDGWQLRLEGLLLKTNGSSEIRARCTGEISDATALGTELGNKLRSQAGSGFGLA
jgi:hydroxymethylbilane synthase